MTHSYPTRRSSDLSAFDRPDAADFPLQLHHAIEQGLGGRRAAGNIDVDRHDAVAAAHHRIAVMIIAAAIGAAAHRNHIFGIRSEEHTSELQSLMRSSYADFCFKKKTKNT